MGNLELKPWTLPLIVAAIVVPVAAAFAAAGPAVGLAVGAVIAFAVAIIAALQRPGGMIETASAPDDRRRVLVVVGHELDDPETVEAIKRERGLDVGAGETEVRLLAPAKTRLLDLWATDVGPAREEAQRKLVVSAAALGKADVATKASVGDHDIVRAVEDELRSFAAVEVVLVTGAPAEDPAGERAAQELERRLEQTFVRIVAGTTERL